MRTYVRYGSKADISGVIRDVRFTPESGHWPIGSECLLLAKSGHSHPDKTFIGRIEKAAIGSLVHAAYEIGVRARR